MTDENDEHKHWNCPPVRLPRGNDLSGDPGDVKTYIDHSDQYFDDHGEEDESISVKQYTGEPLIDKGFVDDHEEPVGQIQWNDPIDPDPFEGTSIDLTDYAGLRECSGTLIADDLFLTAGHCFVIDGGPSPADVARQMHVNFNYQRDSEGNLPDRDDVDRYDVDKLVEHVFQHAGLDYAILRLKGDHDSDSENDVPGCDGYETAKVAWGDAQKDDTLCIIGHPNGLPKRIVTGNATHLHDVRIGYDNINTAPGSSGAGILREDTGRLVGVHSESGFGINKGHNHGIRISAILSVSPVLRDLVEGPYRYESHAAFVDSRRSTLQPDDKNKGGGKPKGK